VHVTFAEWTNRSAPVIAAAAAAAAVEEQHITYHGTGHGGHDMLGSDRPTLVCYCSFYQIDGSIQSRCPQPMLLLHIPRKINIGPNLLDYL